MARDDDEWGIRLADARIPSWWSGGVSVLVFAALYRSLRDRRRWAEAETSITKATAVLAQRMKEGDERDARIAELTERMESYGRTSVALTRASLAVAVVALIVAVVAVILAS